MKSRVLSSNLRKKAELMYRKYRAIMILTFGITQNQRKKIDRNLKILPTLTRREILARLPELDKILKEISERYGVKGTLRQMENLINKKSTLPGETFLLLSKFHIQELYDHYERSLPIFPDLPPHARIGIDVLGIRKQARKIEIYLLEASLFEDMAALWNNTLEVSESARTHGNEKAELIKRKNALKRATAKAVFNLLEGYLNGIALDIYLSRDTTPEEEMKLMEWDAERSRPRPLSLRDKLLQYPKITLKKKHPPLDENNCQEMAKILELEQRIRHSLIHPKPGILQGGSVYNIREAVYIHLSNEEVAELCDIAINLIEKINKTIEEKFGKVDFWLHRHDESGRFPGETFV